MAAGVRVSEFWSLTPWELECAISGATERRHYEQETVARMTANLMNVQLAKGHKIRPEDLYRRPDAVPEFVDSASFKRWMREHGRDSEEEE